MKIVSIDGDKSHSRLIDKYFDQLGVDGNTFDDFKQFHIWLTECDNTSKTEIDFIFVGVNNHEDNSFNEAVLLKEYMPAKMPVIIFMLNEHSDKSYIRSLKYGAGYLLKPFSSDLFISAIHYHSKHKEINRLLGKKNNELLQYKKANDREHAIVESIFSNHFEQHLLESDNINFYISPASIFNGDVLLTEQGPSGSLYLVVGDVTGHGLSAAIGAMPVYSTFRAMAKKGMPVGKIAFEMNKALRTLLPDNMMMAATIMELDYSDGTAVVWSGGMPEVIVINDQSAIVRKIGSRHSPLSMLEEESFRQDIDVIALQTGDRLFFHTDGIEEASNASGDMFGAERFLSLFDGSSALIFNKIVDSHSQFIGDSSQGDDITLVEVTYFPDTTLTPSLTNKERLDVSAIQWDMSFHITPKEIKKSDPLSQIINFLSGSIGVSVHQDYISTILSELFNNALDHGLLGLDSSGKNTDDGFIRYYVERRKKIAVLNSGFIDINISYKSIEYDNTFLNITFTDTGHGFDFSSLTYEQELDPRGYGHGLRLVNSLCKSITYSNSGRTVSVVYKIT